MPRRPTPPAPPSPAAATAAIEARIRPSGDPVLGLWLHVAYHRFMASFGLASHGEISPNLVGLLALLELHPGASQAEFARQLGLERATVGQQVARAVAQGFVRRRAATGGARRFELHLTRRGKAMLAALRRRIPAHERAAAVALAPDERRQLRDLLAKLLGAGAAPPRIASKSRKA